MLSLKLHTTENLHYNLVTTQWPTLRIQFTYFNIHRVLPFTNTLHSVDDVHRVLASIDDCSWFNLLVLVRAIK